MNSRISQDLGKRGDRGTVGPAGPMGLPGTKESQGKNGQSKVAQSAFVFVNSEEFTKFPRPIAHKVVYIGGIAVPATKPLTTEWQAVMDASTDGAVLVSFGSLTRSSEMPERIRNAFLWVFQQFPKVKFIWKYEADDSVARNLSNVVKAKWIPQNDLLSHSNMRAFVTHAGMNSVTEAVYAGVPMLLVPLFGDQMRNAKVVEKRAIGIIVDKFAFTADLLADRIDALLTQKRFAVNARRLSRMARRKPFGTRERLVRYVEFAAAFGPLTC